MWVPRHCQAILRTDLGSVAVFGTPTKGAGSLPIPHTDNGNGKSPESHILVTERYFSGYSQPAGSTALPLTSTSKCKWQPVELPVVPLSETTSPRFTFAPTETLRLVLWL